MFQSMKNLIGFTVRAHDGDCGKIKDVLFDDTTRAVRYFVVDTGGWLTNRQVLLAPAAVERPDGESRTIPTSLTKRSIEDSPNVESDKPISRQHEVALADYYNWPAYWGAMGHAGVPLRPVTTAVADEEADPNLRSVSEVIGYDIECTEGSLGHVEDLILDTEEWSVRYLVVDTRNWLPGGKKVMLVYDWLTHFSWPERKAFVDLQQDQVRSAPEYDPRAPVNREMEARLFDFYGRPTYW